jgi:Uma2 family endonuclease
MRTPLFPDAVITGELLEHLRIPGVERYELVEGRLEISTPTNRRHAEMVARLAALLGQRPGWHVLVGDPGLYIRRRPDTVRGPDVILISDDLYRQTDPARSFLTVAPELVVEVRSPSNETEEIAVKVREYLALGSRVLVIDVEAKVLQLATVEELTAVTTVELPNGATLTHAELFV